MGEVGSWGLMVSYARSCKTLEWVLVEAAGRKPGVREGMLGGFAPALLG